MNPIVSPENRDDNIVYIHMFTCMYYTYTSKIHTSHTDNYQHKNTDVYYTKKSRYGIHETIIGTTVDMIKKDINPGYG